MMTTTYILAFILFAFCAASLSRLYMMLIQPSHFLHFMQRVIFYFEKRNDFMYRSFGGCPVCVTQRFSELTYVILCIIFVPKIWFGIAMFVLYGACVYGISNLMNKEVKVETKQQKIEL